jgi:hypothetical protein
MTIQFSNGVLRIDHATGDNTFTPNQDVKADSAKQASEDASSANGESEQAPATKKAEQAKPSDAKTTTAK